MNAQAVTQLLDELTKRLDGPAQKMFNIMVLQHHNVGVLDLVVGVIMLIIAGLTLVGAVYASHQLSDPDITYDDAYQSILITCLAVCVITFMVAVFCITAGYLQLSNPAYYAIKDILSAIKGS